MEDFLLREVIVKCKEATERDIRYTTLSPNELFQKKLNEEFDKCNYLNEDTFLYIQDIEIVDQEETSKAGLGLKTIVGASLSFAGLPILKKRFVMKGASSGTSIASKYLSKALPYRMPKRFMGTMILGRAIGRAVPYVGGILIAIDVIEVLIEEADKDKYIDPFSPRGGRFGGGGAGRLW